MAGYLIFLGDIRDDKGHLIRSAKDTHRDLCRDGIYSTRLALGQSTKDGMWAITKEKTFTDYFGMKTGDLVFFFYDRMIYGVSRLVDIGGDCKSWCYQDAWKPTFRDQASIDPTKIYPACVPEDRCVCFFEPYPEYYKLGIDMDEALCAYPSAFKALRVIEGISFIRMDDEEASALVALLTKKNIGVAPDRLFDPSVHTTIAGKITFDPSYRMTSSSVLSNYAVVDVDKISHEQMVEGALIEALTNGRDRDVLGKWDYVCHQVSASPAKPVGYMEWMDVFGYHVSEELAGKVPVQFAIDKYMVIEIKANQLFCRSKSGKETNATLACKAVVTQLMKYVDWIAKTYAGGSYPMVDAMIVANGFDEEFVEYFKANAIRNYNKGYREATPAIWDQIKLIKYSFDGSKIGFEQVYPSA